jgi:hypothetical protein
MAETTNPPPSSNPPPAPILSPWPKVLLWTSIVFMLLAAVVFMFKSCRDLPGELVHKAGQALTDVATAFKRNNTITTSFTSYATTITNSLYLQVTTLKQQEIFTRTEEPSTGFGYIPLPDVVVEARAPVDYTYYLDLNAEWRLVLRDGLIQVFAPPIHFNKPAVDVSKIEYEVRKSGLMKKAEVMENLKQSLTGLVVLRAKENIPLVRENVRRQATEFVEKWLAKSFTDGKNYPVKVYFPDEKPPFGISIKTTPLN